MADSATVGILRTMLTMDTASFESGAKRAVTTAKSTETAISGLGKEVQKLTPLAERMVKSLGGDKLLYTANSLTAAVTKLGGAQKLTEAEQARVNKTLDAAITKYKKLGQEAPQAMVDLEKATRKAGDGTSFLSAKMVGLAAAAGTFAAQLAGQAIRSVINMGKEAFTTAGEIVDLSSKTGLSTKTIQQMKFVADQTGGSLEAFTNAAFQLSLRVEQNGPAVQKALDKLRAYGLEVEKFRQSRPDEQWNMIVAALGKVESQGERAALGQALMGKTFKDVAGSIREGYVGIADQAKLATDAQLRELERLGDEWTKFRKNLVAGFAAAMGEVVLRNRVAAQVMREDLASGNQRTPSDFNAEVQRRILLNLVDARTKDIKLTAEQAQAQQTYAQQLAAVRAELAKLTPAQRAEIDAAVQLGVNTEELEAKFGLTEGALRLYSAGAKAAAASSKELAKSQKELAKEAEEANRRWLDILGQIDAAEIRRNRSKLTGPGLTPDGRGLQSQIPALEPPSVDEALSELKRLEKGEADWRAYQNFLGERALEDEAARLEERKRRYEEFANFMRGLFAPLVSSVTGGLGTLLFGDGTDDGSRRQADEAKAHFEAITKNGKASAEEVTRAFHAWREAESRANSAFAERFKQMWQGIRRSLVGILDQILSHFINQFLGGMIKAIANSALGQSVGNWFAKALGFGASAIPAVGSIAGAVIPGVATAGATAAATAGSTAAATTVAAGTAGGGLAGLGAFLTNPWTIGIAGAALGITALFKAGVGRGGWEGVEGNKRRDAFIRQFQERFGGTPDEAVASAFAKAKVSDAVANRLWVDLLHADKKSTFEKAESDILSRLAAGGVKGLKPFNLGGFVPPNAVVPAILHGGSMGEAIIPLEKAQKQGGLGAPTVVHNHTWNVQTWDTADWKRNFKSKILPQFRFSVLTDGETRSTVREAALT